MSNPKPMIETAARSSQNLARGAVREVIAEGLVVIERADGAEAWLCDILQTDARIAIISVGDEVLFWHSGIEGERGVVLGRIGGERREDVAEPEGEAPDCLVLEAKQEISLRVGDGSITIRADGKILIKGTDLVSHAKRLNRIKGGAVAIN